jgi:hypothetical protein
MSCRKKDDHPTGHRTQPHEVVKLGIPGPDLLLIVRHSRRRGLPVKAREFQGGISLSDLRKAAAVTPSMCLTMARALSGGLPMVVPCNLQCSLVRDTNCVESNSEPDLVLFLTNLLAVALAG